ncbi:hypothetical protein ACFL0V_06635, partial [Nanoarchaeota archaeon]
MKKEGFWLVVFLLLLPLAFALPLDDSGPASGPLEEEVSFEEGLPLPDTTPAAGYWVATVYDPTRDPGIYPEPVIPYYYPTEPNTDTKERSNILGGEQPHTARQAPDVTDMLSTWTSLNYLDIYDRFDIPKDASGQYQAEIIALKFVLDLSLFKETHIWGEGFEPVDLTATIPSHGGISSDGEIPSKDAYEGPVPADWGSSIDLDCMRCEYGDNLHECFDGGRWSCVYIPILKRRDCSVLADMDQPFCEGVELVGPNEDLESPFNAIRLTSFPGYGGCQENYGPTMTGHSDSVGRDWYTEDDGLSDSFRPYEDSSTKDDIGRCCGNDPEDLGALAQSITDPLDTNLNHLMCRPNAEFNGILPSGNPAIDDTITYVWSDAESDSFNIYSINRSGMLFDAVANYYNWFVCDSSSQYSDPDGLNMIYSKFDNDNTPSPLLYEFDMLPEGPIGFGYGVTGGVGGEGDLDEGHSFGLPSETSGFESASSVVDQDLFDDDLSVSGPPFATACDQDGDGYDGEYTQDIIDVNAPVGTRSDDYPKYNTECDGPQPPYDCDEKDASVNPGANEYCGAADPTRDYNCNGIPNSQDFCIPADTENPCAPGGDPSQCNITARDYAPRFICYEQTLEEEVVKGSFAECCGFSLDFCRNTFPEGRREGSAIKTLREFHAFDPASQSKECPKKDSNCVLKYGISKAKKNHADDHILYSMAFFTDTGDIKIHDWNKDTYDYLEFYIYYAANFLQNIKIGRLVGPSPGAHDSYAYYFDEPIVNYVVNEPQLGRWLHVVIPIEEFKADPVDVDIIVLYADSADIYAVDTEVSAMGGTEFSNVIGLDKIHLVGNSGNRFCTGTFPVSTWIGDLDNAESVDGGDVDDPRDLYKQLGRAACSAIPSYGWTGNSCCGDDTGNNTDFNPNQPRNSVIGDDTFKEFFNDTEAGCWAGKRVADGERMMLVQYNISHHEYQRLYNKSCTSRDNCVYNIPRVPGLIIQNPNHDQYDLVITSGTGVTRTKVGAGTVLQNATAMGAFLKSEGVPMRILFTDRKFVTCNAQDADYLYDLPNTNTEETLLIDPDDNYESCDIVGQF